MHAQNLLFRMLRPAVDRPSTSCRKPRVRGDNQGGWGRQLGWIVAGAVPDRRPACDSVTTCRTAGVLNSREETPSARHAHHRSAGEIVRAGAAVGGAGSLLGGCSARRALLWRRPRFRAGLGGLAGRAANRAASAVSGGRIAAKRGVVGNPLARRLARRRTGGGPGGTAGLLRLCERRERECAREQGPAGESTRKTISLPASLWERVDEFMFASRIKKDSVAIRRLVERGLDAEEADAARSAGGPSRSDAAQPRWSPSGSDAGKKPAGAGRKPGGGRQ